ncbi:beta family protein [Streptomyces decoyicus]|uniref:beta family protein n=1 Tax=Streptomyces decoyicus TaxID=249567 RepID=UPI003868EDB8|nr:beta family protein [Streptomyces decoyicus]
MVEPLYVPVLPVKRNALGAYAALAPSVRARTMPLWTLAPRTGPPRSLGHRPEAPVDRDTTALTHWLQVRVSEVIKAQQATPAWLDAFHVEDERRPVTTGVWELLADSPLRPVTGVGRAEWQTTACAELARASGNGLGIRVLLNGLPDERRTDAVQGLLDRIGSPPVAVDLLLDLGAVTDEHHSADKWALRALDLLGPLYRWRTVAVMAGAFPGSLPEFFPAAPEEAHRFDWDIWHMVRHVWSGHPLPVTYGDYGAHHTGGADQPSDSGGGPPWGVLRYTAERTFLLVKTPTAGEDRSVIVRSHARQLVGAHDFRGPAFSAGERWLRDCAYGEGGSGSGNPATWIWAGHIQHMTYVVHTLRAFPGHAVGALPVGA